MGAHLTDRQKKKIIADRIEGMSLRRIAAKYGVTEYAVRKTIKDNPDIAQKIAKKKEQNTLDMIEFLDSQKTSAQEFVLLAMQYLKDPEKLNKAGAQALATAMGIVIDKFMPVEKKQETDAVKVIIDV